MQPTFEKLALIARTLESFHSQKRSQFEKLTRLAAKGVTRDVAFSKMSPERIKTRLAEYSRDIEATAALISEVRHDIVALAEGNTEGRRPNGGRPVACNPQEE